MKIHSVADEIVRKLKEASVNVVFGVPSVHNIRLYEALREAPSIRHILCRQETMAVHMADGYAREGHRIGVVVSSTGPGSGYTVPALQEAWGSSSPVLLVTTNVPAAKIGRGLGVLHELENQEALFRNITKATIVVRSVDEIPSRVREAIEITCSGRPGPVYLEVPTDLLSEKVSEGEEGDPKREHGNKAIRGLEKALTLLRGARRPLIIAGSGAVNPAVAAHIRSLAETLAAPVIATPGAKGVMAEDHLLGFGNMIRKGIVRELVQSCDLTLAIGSRLREADAKRHGLMFPQLIHMDWDRQWINRNFPSEVALIGDIATIVKMLVDRVGSIPPPTHRVTWVKEMRRRLQREMTEISEANREMEYLEIIRGSLPRESTLVIDNTQLGYWAEYFYPSYCPGGLMAAKGSATIGFAFAAAIGAKIASPEKPVLALIGDGGFLYSAQELATCVRHKTRFPVIVANDNAYGVIGYLQRAAYQKEYESRLVNPDFVGLARAYGVRAARAESAGDFKKALQKALASGEMWVIELVSPVIDPPFGRY